MESFSETDLVLFAIPVYSIIILVEIVLSSLEHRPVYSVKGLLENVYLSFFNAGIEVMARGVAYYMLLLAFEVHFFRIENVVLYWVVLLFGLDFLFYLLHCAEHHCRLFWAVHVTHHSSEEFNLTVGFRSSVFQPMYRFLFFIPLALSGFEPIDIFFVYSACQIYGILLHTQLVGKLGIAEWFLVTPSHHRVHHGSNPEYIDKNMGMVFIIWDRLFGTFREEIMPVKYGITVPLKDRKVTTVLFHEWCRLLHDLRQTPSIREKMKCAIGPPDGMSVMKEERKDEEQIRLPIIP